MKTEALCLASAKDVFREQSTALDAKKAVCGQQQRSLGGVMFVGLFALSIDQRLQ